MPMCGSDLSIVVEHECMPLTRKDAANDPGLIATGRLSATTD